MSEYRELLIGCGYARDKRVRAPSHLSREWKNLQTLDHNPECKPDNVCNLNRPPWGDDGAVFVSDLFDEIHAYEVLEHLGRQGDAGLFFDTFAEIYRLLKPNGYLCGTTPSRLSPWLWGDPSHTRVILPESLLFLDQEIIRQNRDHKTAMSDFTHLWRGDFRIVYSREVELTHSFILRAIKPAGASSDPLDIT